MVYFIYLTCFILFGGSLLNFSKKLLFLMIIEGLMVSCIFSYSNFMAGTQSSSMIMVILSIFLVIESVLGISLLIFSSRASSITCYPLFNV